MTEIEAIKQSSFINAKIARALIKTICAAVRPDEYTIPQNMILRFGLLSDDIQGDWDSLEKQSVGENVQTDD